MGGRVAVDETGKRYGKWTVLRRVPNVKGRRDALWACQCVCGRESVVTGGNLRSGGSTQCRWCGNSGFVDLSGRRFGKWTVIKRVPVPEGYHNTPYYRVKCDCGNEADVQAGALRSGKTKQCMPCAFFLPEGEAAFNRVYLWYNRHAEERALVWELSKDQFRQLIQMDCHWCSIEPSTTYNNSANNGGITYNGVDRIDNSKGYVASNVVPCCFTCNHAKSAMTMDDWSAWVLRVARRYNENPDVFSR